MLAVEIRQFMFEKGTIPTNAFEEYDKNGGTPTAILHNKPTHNESMQLLLDETAARHPDRLAGVHQKFGAAEHRRR